MARRSKTWQRARQPEQKEERRTAILQAAGNLLDAEGLPGTGLNAIAREAGLSKANLYRYFESREAILMRLLLDEVEDWHKAFERRLKRLEGTGDVAGVARAFADTLAPRDRFGELLCALGDVLEHNVGVELVTEFKREFLRLTEGPTHALAAALDLEPERAFGAITNLVMTALGAWPHSKPSPVVAEVLAKPEFAAFRIDLKPLLREAALDYLTGVLAREAED